MARSAGASPSLQAAKKPAMRRAAMKTSMRRASSFFERSTSIGAGARGSKAIKMAGAPADNPLLPWQASG